AACSYMRRCCPPARTLLRCSCPGSDSNRHCIAFEAIACCQLGYRGVAFKFRQWLGFCSVATQRRVLIAEDEALIRLDLKEMLEEEGYDVVGEAGDGMTAVKLED